MAEAVAEGDEELRFLEQIKFTCAEVAKLVRRAVDERSMPLVLGGDHSIALGTLAGLRRDGPGGVLWLDAHGDLNTPETSLTGNVHGMVLAALSALVEPRSSTQPGRFPRSIRFASRSSACGRSTTPSAHCSARLGAVVYTMSDLDRLGVEHAIREALEHIDGPGFVHVSLDMDVVDPSDAPGVGTPVRGGLTYREAHLAMELVAESGIVGSLDVVEVNPILDRENETARLAVELVASALSARIL